MKWINYHHLMYFRMIATEGSISKAAAKLRVGQPALSSQLKTLEMHFGQSLFERKHRRLHLTEAGKVALKYANEIHTKGQELLEVIEERTFSTRVHLRIGALDSIPKTLITRLIEEARRFPHCHVTVLEGRGDELLRELMSHQLDILLSNYPAPTSEEGIYSHSLAKVPVALFAAPQYAPLKKRFPGSLAGQPMILPTNHSKLRQDIEHYFAINDLIHETVAEIQDTSVQKQLALDGAGLVPLPEFSVYSYLQDEKLIKLGLLKGVYEEFWMISARRTIENPVATELVRNFRFAF